MNTPLSNRFALGASLAVLVVACSGADDGGDGAGTGGSPVAQGGQSAIGGVSTTGGQTSSGTTTAATGGATTALGGTTSIQSGTEQPSAGGAVVQGGATTTGGKSSTGGTKTTGGTTTTGGKSSTGGTKATGGTTTTGGKSSTGGTKATGGTTTTGGATATGGTTGVCTPDWGTVPTNVSAWINESWNAQLKGNINGRQAWLLDSVMKGKGQVNLCVRWGATSAPSATVKSNMAAAVSKWFNDWFAQLSGYGCFPYSTITTKVTGWAVKPGSTSWVSDLDSSIRVYTETDAEGEPKCSDSCSFFTNWNHSFPNCTGGEAYHHDYWLWLDDSIGGGAAAVGGDWGLRMPVSNFIASMGKSNLVIEHEMGHGFGFQDYYDWTGSTPTGGSLMIVGSTSSQSATTADAWLLRRTWKEMKTLRSW